MLALTGSSGFIGKAVSPHLLFPQKRLVSEIPFGNTTPSSCCYILGDLVNQSNVLRLVENTDTLVHLACRCNPRNSNHRFQEIIDQDLKTTINLFETFAKSNPNGHIVFASSGGNMYQSYAPFIPRTENDAPMPSSGYSIQKLAAEQYLRILCDLYKISATVLRISNPYGFLLPTSRAQGLIGITFSKILFNEALDIFDSAESIRDYLHLDDLTEAFKLVTNCVPTPGTFRLFNVSFGRGYSLHQVLSLIEDVTGRTIKKQYQSSFHTIPSSWSVLSSNHIQKTLGWQPKVNLEEGLRLMWKAIN